jgi:hypothetical protein
MLHDTQPATSQDVSSDPNQPKEVNAAASGQSPHQPDSESSSTSHATTKATSSSFPELHHLLQLSEEQFIELGSDTLARLSEKASASLKASQVRDRQMIFQEMTSRLQATNIDESLNQGTENERKAALKEVKDFLCAIGFRVSIEALEKLIRTRAVAQTKKQGTSR